MKLFIYRTLHATLLIVAVTAHHARADNQNMFLELRSQVAAMRPQLSPERLRSLNSQTATLTDCQNPASSQNKPTIGQHTQYIYNSIYSWTMIRTQGGYCVYAISPVDRTLTIDEARDLLTASHIQFSVPATPKNELPNELHGVLPPGSRHDDMPQVTIPSGDIPNESAKKNMTADSNDWRTPIASTSFPYNTIAYVQTNGSSGSAVQISPYVWMTAAHVLVDQNSGIPYTGGYVFPAYNLPSHTPPIAIADIDYDHQYFPLPASADRYAHDIAFIRIANPHPLAMYPDIFTIISAWDVYSTLYTPCNLGNYYADPFEDTGTSTYLNSWYNGVYFPLSCYINYNLSYPITITAGYPEVVDGSANSAVLPYEDESSVLNGTSGRVPPYGENDVYNYELVHACAGCLLFTGLSTWISPGDSGGPVYGTDSAYGTGNWVLLGINGSQVVGYSGNSPTWGGFSAGSFDYNYQWVKSNSLWTPAALVVISSPTNGGSYNYASVPNLIATAGLLTPQLQWSSNIDGILGVGGNVPVVGKLSPGGQVITATVPGLNVVAKTIQINVTAPAPTFSAPATVQVGSWASTAPFTITYNAPGYISLAWWISWNGGPLVNGHLSTSGGSGTISQEIFSNSTVRLEIFSRGNTTTPIGSLTVQGVVAAPATFSATPVHIVVPASATSGNTTVTWSAPGYTSIDWWGQTNNGPWQGGTLTTAPTGTVVVTVPVGTTYSWRLYPHGARNEGGTTTLLGQVTVNATH
jgi:V8-like Glu-specific endopeptidase